jgi:AcrR family transcriptional regulator
MAATSEILNTKDRIMDEAEKLFAELGFKATSMRAITQAADVNLAAVNYHFGSKDKLIEEVIVRKLRLINGERWRRLENLLKQDTVRIEEILDTFYRPAFEYFQDPEQIPYLRLLGRSLYETGDFTEGVMIKEWMPLMEAYQSAFSTRHARAEHGRHYVAFSLHHRSHDPDHQQDGCPGSDFVRRMLHRRGL